MALATASIDPQRPLGLFWETYGLGATDTATIAITLERPRGGFLERVGQSLRILDTPGSTTIRYAVPPGPSAGAAALGQSIRIALGPLEAGNYTLTLRVTVPGQQPVDARRRVAIQ
jgi:hypothetical protein